MDRERERDRQRVIRQLLLREKTLLIHTNQIVLLSRFSFIPYIFNPVTYNL